MIDTETYLTECPRLRDGVSQVGWLDLRNLYILLTGYSNHCYSYESYSPVLTQTEGTKMLYANDLVLRLLVEERSRELTRQRSSRSPRQPRRFRYALGRSLTRLGSRLADRPVISTQS